MEETGEEKRKKQISRNLEHREKQLQEPSKQARKGAGSEGGTWEGWGRERKKEKKKCR